MGGSHNLEQALAIYTRLRTQAAGGRANTPCDDKDIELTLAALFTERETGQRLMRCDSKPAASRDLNRICV